MAKARLVKYSPLAAVMLEATIIGGLHLQCLQALVTVRRDNKEDPTRRVEDHFQNTEKGPPSASNPVPTIVNSFASTAASAARPPGPGVLHLGKEVAGDQLFVFELAGLHHLVAITTNCASSLVWCLVLCSSQGKQSMMAPDIDQGGMLISALSISCPLAVPTLRNASVNCWSSHVSTGLNCPFDTPSR